MKQFTAIFLLFILLVSSLNVTYAKHFCGGIAVKSAISLGHEHLSCGMASDDNSCENDTDNDKLEDDCCKNDFLSLAVEDYNPSTKVEMNIQAQVAIVCSIIFQNLFTETVVSDSFAESPPPILKESRQVLFQSFLI